MSKDISIIDSDPAKDAGGPRLRGSVHHALEARFALQRPGDAAVTGDNAPLACPASAPPTPRTQISGEVVGGLCARCELRAALLAPLHNRELRQRMRASDCATFASSGFCVRVRSAAADENTPAAPEGLTKSLPHALVSSEAWADKETSVRL